MRLTVVGAGYVGLTLALLLSELGHTVTLVEQSASRIAQLKAGQLPFVEPGLEDALAHALALQTLRFVPFTQWAHWHDQAIFVCVGTPVLPDGLFDLAPVQQVMAHIALFATAPQQVIIRSTVAPGTCQRLQALLDERSKYQHTVSHLPEFLRQGQAWHDCQHPARLILGLDHSSETIDTAQTYLLLRQIFHAYPASVPWSIVPTATAELAKLAANSFLATKISWANELASVCDGAQIDSASVLALVGADPRIGGWGLQAGIGYGGSCLPKDTKALMQLANRYGVRADVLAAVEQRNQQQSGWALTKLQQALGLTGWCGVPLAVWGISFKGATDDLRHSPALPIIEHLVAQGAQLCLFQPQGLAAAQAVLAHTTLSYSHNAEAACTNAQALLVLSDWAEFAQADWAQVAASLATPFVLDGKGCLDSATLARHGLTRLALGQPNPMVKSLWTIQPTCTGVPVV
jgi:UDPglucose 6-dehydrogenase